MKRKAPAGSLFLFVLFFCARMISAEISWFESNKTGVPLRPLLAGAPADYALSLETLPGLEIRRLFSAERREIKRWERRLSDTGIPLEETSYEEGRIASVKRYFATGLLKEEVLYRDGRPDGRFLFEHKDNLPATVVFSRPDATEGYRDEYLYLPSGEFRGVKRLYDDGKIYTSIFTSLNGLPREEWHSFEGADILFRYDRRGNILFQEERRGGKPTDRVDFTYEETPPFRLKERSARDLASGRETRLEYAEDGHPGRETVFERGERVAVTLFAYQDNRLARKDRRFRGGRELWEYRYDEEGAMTKEYYTLDNELKKIVLYDPSPEYSSIEEHYKDGFVFLRLYFLDGKQIRRELLSGAAP